MTTDETRGAIDVTGQWFLRLPDVRTEERDLGVEYSRKMLYVDRAISELLFDGVPAERLAKVLGLSVALIEERASRHRRRVGEP